MTHEVTLNEIYKEGCEDLIEDEPNSYEININKLLIKEQLRYLEVNRYPLTKINLDKEYFKDKDLEIFERYIGPVVFPCNGEPSAFYPRKKSMDLKNVCK